MQFPKHRMIVLIWHVLILTQLLWAFFAWRDDGVHWIWVPLFATPLLVVIATLAPLSPARRSIACWVLAAASIPSAAAGLASIIGWMFIVSVVMLIWAARRENPASEMVQM